MAGIVAVTGAAGVLGRATVDVLRGAGWVVVGIDRADLRQGAGMLPALGGVDLTDEAQMAGAADHIRKVHRRLDGLVNIAGGFSWETVAEGEGATWDRLYTMNVKTTLVASRALLPLLQGGGAIVNVGAAASIKAGKGMGAYAAAKSGVARLTEAMAEEQKDAGIRVNAVLPSIIDTPANRADMPDADFSRWVAPGQLAAVIAFLLSPAAAAVTGALVPVTGRV
ncbi:SDR family NAD(P)-dependent oxidoreductase [Nitrospirillum iridis]|uniref:NAD(P)-dependent dehydrogenase (Short-subunit alcohol dehydrogenase family) n=1 Tax=Nitrospirillum iridis TaxID=765888 RepID=A0A7X0B054_9PROT|nr:SDR family NAD(P)-dependent oxidoreductase [Nitrospirillum iridis]MBB6253339.1 NAD(P)-dependent dehydrogenase (short-subunit alcohol dehydrogenase family) [Nitrospirillum iridis]